MPDRLYANEGIHEEVCYTSTSRGAQVALLKTQQLGTNQ
jgi:hypothetical protein